MVPDRWTARCRGGVLAQPQVRARLIVVERIRSQVVNAVPVNISVIVMAMIFGHFVVSMSVAFTTMMYMAVTVDI